MHQLAKWMYQSVVKIPHEAALMIIQNFWKSQIPEAECSQSQVPNPA